MDSLGILWTLLGLFLAYFVFFYKSRRSRMLDEFKTPSEGNHPLFGIIPFFLSAKKTDLIPIMCGWCEKYGGALRLKSPFGSAIIIMNGSYTEKLLTSQTNLTKGFDYDYVRPWLGDGLLMSTGQKWGQRRKMLTPAFHFKILEDFMQVFNLEAQKMASIMKKDCKPEVSFDICHYISRCALDIICETAMGRSVNAQDHQNIEYIQAINTFGRLVQDRSFRPWYRFNFLFRFSSMYSQQKIILNILHEFTNKVIREKKQEFDNKRSQNPSKLNVIAEEEEEDENIYFKSKKRLAFLDLLLEVQREKGEGELSDLDIREETDTFMFEGHDTTAANASFTVYALGCYPEIQKKVQEELDEIFGDDKTRDVTIEDLTKMKYLELVVKESLRVYPSVPFIQRQLTSDLTIDDGRQIPEGTTIGLFLYQIHRDPKAFPEPHEFRPERFENTTHDPFAYIPFSAGPRNCIGQKFAMMEEKVMLATIFRYFQVKSMIHPKDLKLLSEMILRSEDGLPVQIKPR